MPVSACPRALSYWLIVALLALVFPGLAGGQTTDRVYRLGALMLSAGSVERVRTYVLPVLARQGFVEGRKLVLEARIGTVAELPALAEELLAAKPDAILANGLMAIRAVRAHSNTVPIVGAFIDGDPVAAGIAASLARPGGNVTGVVMLGPELDAKRLELLHQAVPTARRIAALRVSPKRSEESLAAVRGAAEALGCRVVALLCGSSCGLSGSFRRDAVGSRTRAGDHRGPGVLYQCVDACHVSARGRIADRLRMAKDGRAGMSPRLRSGHCRAERP